MYVNKIALTSYLDPSQVLFDDKEASVHYEKIEKLPYLVEAEDLIEKIFAASPTSTVEEKKAALKNLSIEELEDLLDNDRSSEASASVVEKLSQAFIKDEVQKIHEVAIDPVLKPLRHQNRLEKKEATAIIQKMLVDIRGSGSSVEKTRVISAAWHCPTKTLQQIVGLDSEQKRTKQEQATAIMLFIKAYRPKNTIPPTPEEVLDTIQNLIKLNRGSTDDQKRFESIKDRLVNPLVYFTEKATLPAINAACQVPFNPENEVLLFTALRMICSADGSHARIFPEATRPRIASSTPMVERFKYIDAMVEKYEQTPQKSDTTAVDLHHYAISPLEEKQKILANSSLAKALALQRYDILSENAITFKQAGKEMTIAGEKELVCRLVDKGVSAERACAAFTVPHSQTHNPYFKSLVNLATSPKTPTISSQDLDNIIKKDRSYDAIKQLSSIIEKISLTEPQNDSLDFTSEDMPPIINNFDAVKNTALPSGRSSIIPIIDFASTKKETEFNH